MKIINIILLFVFLITNELGYAEKDLQNLNYEIKKLKEQAKKEKNNLNSTLYELNKVQYNKKKLEDAIENIDMKMNAAEERIKTLNEEMERALNDSKKANEELEKLSYRSDKRNEMLKKRLRLMYEAGDISYLDILLDSENVSQFFDRLFIIKKILEQDKKILDEQRKDKQNIEKRKTEINDNISMLDKFSNESEIIKGLLEEQKKERKVIIQALEEEEGSIEEIKVEHEQSLMEISNQIKGLLVETYEFNFGDSYIEGKFIWPVPNHTKITSTFGNREDPINGKAASHKGLDIGAPSGSTIVAVENGVVVFADYSNGYGNTVVIEHSNGLRTLYAHIRSGGIFVKEGQKVNKGQKIAEVGSTGRSTGPHLHLGLYKNGVIANPLQYLK